MKSLCTPAMVYLVLAILALVMAFRYVSLMTLTSKLIFALIWTWFLNFLCSKGHSGISWFLVLIPYILMAMMMLLAMDAASSGKKEGYYGIGSGGVIPTAPSDMEKAPSPFMEKAPSPDMEKYRRPRHVPRSSW